MRRTVLLGVVTAVGLALGAGAAMRSTAALEPAPVKVQQAPAFMDHAPQIAPLLGFSLPIFQTDQLPNGLRIIVVQDRRFPLVTIHVTLRAGASRLTPATAGLARAEAALLSAGTDTRSAPEIAAALAAMGGTMSFGADQDFLYVNARALNSSAQPLLELVSDLVLHPAFPAAAVAREQTELRLAVAARRARAPAVARATFHRLLFGANPYAITGATAASIPQITRAALVAFHQKYFLPNNQATIVIVGDIPAARAHNLVQQYFGDWRLGIPLPPPSPAVSNPSTPQLVLIERPGAAASTILAGNVGLTRTASSYLAFRIALQVLEERMDRRLVHSSDAAYRDLGAWTLSTHVPTPATAAALRQILAQLGRLRTAPPSAQELIRAKNYLTGAYMIGLQTQSDLARAMLSQAIYGLPSSWLANYVDNLHSVTAADALSAAQAVIQPKHLVIVITGDVHRIEPSLAQALAGQKMTILNEAGDTIGTYGGASKQP
ncbi:MAG: M16 family metallopeptidase [Terriglobales bacterium]